MERGGDETRVGNGRKREVRQGRKNKGLIYHTSSFS